MNLFRLAPAVAVLASAVLSGAPAQAFFHLWRFTEVFSAANGDVQFIELASSGTSETVAGGATITSLATGKVFTFPSNLSGSTLNKRLLIATNGFGSLTGAVTPDFTLPSTDFFDPSGDTLTLFQFQTIDTRSLTSVPADGVMSRHFPANTVGANSPTNFSGAVGSVNVSPPTLAGDFNGDGDVDGLDLVKWQADFGVTGGSDADDDLDSDGADFLIWQRQLGESSSTPLATAVPELDASSLAAAGLMAALAMPRPPLRRRTKTRTC